MLKMVDVILGNGEYVIRKGTHTANSIDNKEINRDGIDLITTLENYLDHTWLADNALVIVNDYTIYTTPLAQLVDGTWLYDYVEKNYKF